MEIKHIHKYAISHIAGKEWSIFYVVLATQSCQKLSNFMNFVNSLYKLADKCANQQVCYDTQF